MFIVVLRYALCTVLALPLALTSAKAATPQGQFAIEGAGLATCSAFVAARKARNETRTATQSKSDLDDKSISGVDAYARMIGWVEGYMTAANRYVGDTFDLAPWQTPELYGIIIGQHCEKNPDDRLFNVVEKVVLSLTPDRLKQPSDMVSLSVKGRGMLMYTEVIRRAQDALKKQKLYQGEVNGRWDQATQLGFANYQAAVGLQDTGLPDPITLWLLFSPAVSQATATTKKSAK
jgi:hypothetical protein